MESLHVVEDVANPAELALTQIDVVLGDFDLVSTTEEHQALAELDLVSDIMGFSGKRYFVEASHSFCLPMDFNRDEDVPYTNFNSGLAFCGHLTTFGVIKIGRLELLGTDVCVRSLCLVFCKFLRLDNLQETKETDRRMLCTPAYAVEAISVEN